MLPCLMPRLLVLAAVLLWLGTATAVAAAPPPRPSGSSVAAAEAGDADGHPGPAKTVVETVADTITTRECPWIELNGTLCRKVGQRCSCLTGCHRVSGIGSRGPVLLVSALHHRTCLVDMLHTATMPSYPTVVHSAVATPAPCLAVLLHAAVPAASVPGACRLLQSQQQHHRPLGQRIRLGENLHHVMRAADQRVQQAGRVLQLVGSQMLHTAGYGRWALLGSQHNRGSEAANQQRQLQLAEPVGVAQLQDPAWLWHAGA